MQTPYTITTEGRLCTVYKDGKITAKGFFDVESALHAIWVDEGKILEDWYYELDGAVIKGTKVEKDDSV